MTKEALRNDKQNVGVSLDRPLYERLALYQKSFEIKPKYSSITKKAIDEFLTKRGF